MERFASLDINEINDKLNCFFQLNEQNDSLQSAKALIRTEELLFQHLSLGLQLIDLSNKK